MKTLLLMAVIVALPAAAQVTERYGDAANSVTLVQSFDQRELSAVIREDELGRVRQGRPGSPLIGRAQGYWVRVRYADGQLVCEKFAIRPRGWSDDEARARAEELLRKSCT